MKLVISQNKDGKGYYTKIQNDYMGVHSEKYLSLQLSKKIQQPLEYGLYEVDGLMSCFAKKDGTTELKFIVTKAIPTQKYETKEEPKEEENPFEVFGEQIEVTDNFLE